MNNSHEEDVRRIFDCFCKKVLRNEARDYYAEPNGDKIIPPRLFPDGRVIKQLSKDGALESVHITDGNIKAFDPIARKYGVRYHLVKDTSEEPPR